jgi:hypothetical protein
MLTLLLFLQLEREPPLPGLLLHMWRRRRNYGVAGFVLPLR